MNRSAHVLAIACCAAFGSGLCLGQAVTTAPATRPLADATGTSTADCAPHSFTSNETLRLFNGRNLDGFYTYLRERGKNNDPQGVFSVRDGVLRISGAEWGCITTREQYANYRLLLEYKWGQITHPPRVSKARDSGILLHSVGEDGVYGKAWMYSIECNIIEGGTGDFIVVGDGSDRYSLTARVGKEKSAGCHFYDPTETGESATIHLGRLNWFGRDPGWRDVKGFRGARDVEKPVGQWNRLECLAIGDRITVNLNGVRVNSCRDVRPQCGRIQIQSEGAEIFIRRFDLMPIEDKSMTGSQPVAD